MDWRDMDIEDFFEMEREAIMMKAFERIEEEEKEKEEKQ